MWLDSVATVSHPLLQGPRVKLMNAVSNMSSEWCRHVTASLLAISSPLSPTETPAAPPVCDSSDAVQ